MENSDTQQLSDQITNKLETLQYLMKQTTLKIDESHDIEEKRKYEMRLTEQKKLYGELERYSRLGTEEIAKIMQTQSAFENLERYFPSKSNEGKEISKAFEKFNNTRPDNTDKFMNDSKSLFSEKIVKDIIDASKLLRKIREDGMIYNDPYRIEKGQEYEADTLEKHKEYLQLIKEGKIKPSVNEKESKNIEKYIVELNRINDINGSLEIIDLYEKEFITTSLKTAELKKILESNAVKTAADIDRKTKFSKMKESVRDYNSKEENAYRKTEEVRKAIEAYQDICNRIKKEFPTKVIEDQLEAAENDLKRLGIFDFNAIKENNFKYIEEVKTKARASAFEEGKRNEESFQEESTEKKISGQELGKQVMPSLAPEKKGFRDFIKNLLNKFKTKDKDIENNEK